MANEQFGFKIIVRIETDDGDLTLKYPDFEIHFDSEFTDDPTPSETTIDIYNLKDSTRNMIKVGQSIHLQAGFGDDIGDITNAKIKYIHPPVRDGGDQMFEIICYEGEDLSKDEREFTDDTPEHPNEIQVTFAAGVNAWYVLDTLARRAGIPLEIVSLKENKVFNEPYSASGTPISALEEVASEAKSKLFYRRGKLMVRDIHQDEGFDEQFKLSSATGLLDSPQREEDDDWQGYSIRSILNHRMATASIISLSSRYIGGDFRIKSGSHTFDGTNPETNAEIE